jgi:hypothetical protein
MQILSFMFFFDNMTIGDNQVAWSTSWMNHAIKILLKFT